MKKPQAWKNWLAKALVALTLIVFVVILTVPESAHQLLPVAIALLCIQVLWLLAVL